MQADQRRRGTGDLHHSSARHDFIGGGVDANHPPLVCLRAESNHHAGLGQTSAARRHHSVEEDRMCSLLPGNLIGEVRIPETA